MIDGRQQTPDFDPSGGLRQYLEVLRRRKWIVLGVILLAVGAAALFSALQPDKYKATSKIVIVQGNGLPQLQFGNSLQPFVATMGDLIASHVVARNVINNLNLDLTPESLLSKTSVSINPETAVLRVSVVDRDPERARAINAEIGRVFAQVVDQKFGETVTDPQDPNAEAPLTAKVFDPAHVLPRKVQPRPLRNVGLALILGAILGLLAAFLREHFDRGLRTRESVERAFGLPVIGQVPFRRLRKRDERRVVWEGFGEIAEAYRGLRANLQYLAVQRPLTTLLITSAAPEQGKTTVTANLAVAIARSGASTVIVEGDLRRPKLADAFGIETSDAGLTSVLVGAVDLEDAVREVDVPLGTDGRTADAGRISFLSSGPLPPNPSELLSSLQMTQLLDRLAVGNDYVLIDSPPLLLVSDALELARMVDGVVLVVRRSNASTDEAKELRSLIDRLGINLVGVVFSDVTPLGSYGTYGDPVTAPVGGPEPATNGGQPEEEPSASQRRRRRAARSSDRDF